MQNQTNERKRNDNFNTTLLSVRNKKKTKVEIECGYNWYPVWIIVKDWALNKFEKLEKEIDIIKSRYKVSRIMSGRDNSGFWTRFDNHMYVTWLIYKKDLEYVKDLLDYMHDVDPDLGPPSRHVVVQNVPNTVVDESVDTSLVWEILKEYVLKQVCEMSDYLFKNEVYIRKLYSDEQKNWREIWYNNNVDVRKRASKEREKKVQILRDEFYHHLDVFIDFRETEDFLEYMHDVENNV